MLGGGSVEDWEKCRNLWKKKEQSSGRGGNKRLISDSTREDQGNLLARSSGLGGDPWSDLVSWVSSQLNPF